MGQRSRVKGLCSRVHKPQPAVHGSLSGDRSGHGKRTRHLIRNKGLAREKRHRGSESGNTRLLQQVFLGDQEGWWLEAGFKPEASQPVSSLHKVHHGDSRLNFEGVEQGAVASNVGLERCLSSRPNIAGPQAVPQICLPKETLSVQSAPVRVIHGTKGVHQNSGPDSILDTSTGHSVPPLSGRLSADRRFTQSVVQERLLFCRSSSESGVPGELEEVLPRTFAGRSVPGNQNQVGHRHVTFARQQGQGPSPLCSVVPVSQDTGGKNISAYVGSDGSFLTGCTSSQISHAAVPDVFPIQMEHQPTIVTHQNNGTEISDTPPGVLERRGRFVPRRLSKDFAPPSRSHIRRLRHGLGGALHALEGPGSLVQEPTIPAYQLSGTLSSALDVEEIRPSASSQEGVDQDGQHSCQTVHQQARRHCVSELVCVDTESHSVVHSSSHYSRSRACTRSGQHDSRHSVTSNDRPDRVDAQQVRGAQSIRCLGRTPDRPVRHCRQQASPGVLQLAVPRGITPHECDDYLLGRCPCVCLPANSSNSGCNPEGEQGVSVTHSDRAILAQSIVVSSDFASTRRGPHQTSPVAGPSNATRREDASFQPGSLVPGSLEDKRGALMQQGLSEQVADTILASRAQSTYKVYEASWNHYANWCRRQNLDPCTTDVAQVLGFLEYCLTVKRLSYSSIKIRVYAIALYHQKFPLKELSSHPWVMEFLKGCKRKCPAKRCTLPQWDLNLVLQAMRRLPFEPLSVDRIQWLTWKAAFLVAITMAKRIGEIQAFSIDQRYISFNRDAQGQVLGVRLRLNPFFIPKVNTDQNRETEIYLPAFCPRSIPTSTSTLYRCCPARALDVYVKATAAFRKTDQLFVCYQSGAKKGQPASKMTIARWVRAAIEKAYTAMGNDTLTRVRAHSTRSIATTWAQAHNVSLTDICRSATWSTACTFAQHYRLNLASESSARFATGVLQTVLE